MLRTVVMCIALAGALALPAQAGHRDDAKEHEGKGMNLSEKQKADLKELRGEQATAMKQLQLRARALRDQLKVEMAKDNPSEDSLNLQAEQAGALAAEFAKLRVAGLLKAKKILSKEQFLGLLDREGRWGPGPAGERGEHKGGKGKGKGKDPEGRRGGPDGPPPPPEE
jgi:hypothetical protein